MKKRILVIGGGQAQLPLVEAALRQELYVTVIDERGLEASDIAHEVIPYNRYDWECIEKINPQGKFDAVVSGGSDKAVNFMARYAQKYNLPSYVSVAASEFPMQKGRTREVLDGTGIPVPKSVELNGKIEDISCVSSLKEPLVVKPIDGIGQTGVSYVSDKERLYEAVEEAVQVSDSGCVLIQEFIEGPEIGVNGFVFDGEFEIFTIGTRKASRKPDETFGVSLEKAYEKPQYAHIEADVQRILDTACKSQGFENGPIYAQLIVSADNTPYVIEVMPRISGGEDPRLVKFATGFDVCAATVALALGKAVKKEEYVTAQTHDAVLIHFLTAKPGILGEVTGLEVVCNSPGIAHANAFYKAGHVLGELKSSRERLGCIIGVGTNLPEARKHIENAASDLHIDVRGDEVA